MTSSITRREFALATGAAIATRLSNHVSGRSQGAEQISPPGEPFMRELSKLQEVTATPGLGIGVVQGGRLTWERYLGATDASTSQPVTADSLFPAASLGKPVFAWAALRLMDEGKLELDRPLKSYVPDHAPADARGDKVTARHVLGHSSGFRNWRNTADQRLVPDFEPGSRFQYSGEGFYYLQRVIEKVSGMGFEAFIEQSLFEPLGMRSSTYGWRSDTATRLVTGHSRGNPVRQMSRDFATRLLAYAGSKGKPLAEFTHEEIVAAMAAMSPAPPPLPNYIVPNAAASLLTTVRDYAAFLNRVLDPAATPVSLKPATRDDMLRSHTRINSVLSWALGWGLEADKGREYLWHWGDNGSFKNFVLAHLPSRSALVVFTNNVQGMRVAEAIVAAASGHEHVAFDWL
jgi:CubicO group peptidase (beta-lactamase class C family)